MFSEKKVISTYSPKIKPGQFSIPDYFLQKKVPSFNAEVQKKISPVSSRSPFQLQKPGSSQKTSSKSPILMREDKQFEEPRG
jgi:hypothetical protein